MKKIICLIFSSLLITSSCFAERIRFESAGEGTGGVSNTSFYNSSTLWKIGVTH